MYTRRYLFMLTRFSHGHCEEERKPAWANLNILDHGHWDSVTHYLDDVLSALEALAQLITDNRRQVFSGSIKRRTIKIKGSMLTLLRLANIPPVDQLF